MDVRHRSSLRVVAAFVLVVLAISGSGAIGFYAGRVSTDLFPRPKPPSLASSSDDQIGGFDDLVQRWNRYVALSDGYLAPDPYRGMLDSGVVKWFHDVKYMEFAAYLPPRLNPKLSENPHTVVWWENRDDFEETWYAYADGTWKRVPYGKQQYEDTDWRSKLKAAGYPEWRSTEEAEAWLAKNRGSLVWDEQLHLYAFRPTVPSTQAAAIDGNVSDIHLEEGLNGPELSVEGFKRLISTAKPLSPTDPSMKGWSYAPWYSGSFSGPGGTFHFQLFLGGRGTLTSPDGSSGLFSFEGDAK